MRRRTLILCLLAFEALAKGQGVARLRENQTKATLSKNFSSWKIHYFKLISDKFVILIIVFF